MYQFTFRSSGFGSRPQHAAATCLSLLVYAIADGAQRQLHEHPNQQYLPRATLRQSMTTAALRIMNPYASVESGALGGASRSGSPGAPPSPSGRSFAGQQKSLLGSNGNKRSSLDPPDSDDEERMNKRARSQDPESIAAAESMIMAATQGHHRILPAQPMPSQGRTSVLDPYPPFSSASDVAFNRFLAMEQSSLTGMYGRAPMAAAPFYGSPFLGGPLPMDFMGRPPPPSSAAAALRRRADYLESLAYAPSAPFGLGAAGAMPSLATSFNPMMHCPMPSPATSFNPMMNCPPRALPLPERQSPEMLPRRHSHEPASAGDKAKLPPSSPSKPQLTLGNGATEDQEQPLFGTGNRVCIDLSIDQDPNWLSELQCFVRKNLLEVCWANREDVAVRNASKKVSLEQVGIRCRFCAHKPPGSRAQRSSAFPSSIPQLYQSFTMMLRDHFDTCACIPDDVKRRYLCLKSSTCQGATEAKKYWSYSAAKLGMVDSEDGMLMNDNTRAAAKVIPPFGAVAGEVPVPLGDDGKPVALVQPADREYASAFLFNVMSHFQRIELLPSERKGNRKSLRCGLPGFGCIHCSQAGRFGMSRVFPARRRTLPVRVADLYDHLCRCNLCPPEAKKVLRQLREEEKQQTSHEKQFLDRVWERMGHSQANPN
ncbi:expressed unknown protein [Seminavis robusta]|uniref:Uncharacterized protein n=1 Tax=Seminavis robusta TaxID=568900 RepID=A0A9N8DL26_9STRA|nr:expressed unknown protein [Seminavis robusta]|eukprot:Sro203_g085710.1 n/a (654) ;mRNA; r:82693-84975